MLKGECVDIDVLIRSAGSVVRWEHLTLRNHADVAHKGAKLYERFQVRFTFLLWTKIDRMEHDDRLQSCQQC